MWATLDVFAWVKRSRSARVRDYSLGLYRGTAVRVSLLRRPLWDSESWIGAVFNQVSVLWRRRAAGG